MKSSEYQVIRKEGILVYIGMRVIARHTNVYGWTAQHGLLMSHETSGVYRVKAGGSAFFISDISSLLLCEIPRWISG